MRYLPEMLRWLGAFVRPAFDDGVTHDAERRSARRAMLRGAITLPILLVLATVSNKAHADCNYSSGSAATINFAPSSPISVSPSTPVGTSWTTAPVAPSSQLVLSCTGTSSSGYVSSVAGQPSGTDDTLFPTNIPWLSYRILHPDTSSPLHADPNQPVAAGNGTTNITFSVASALQLVVTGPVTSSGTLSGQLGVWQMSYDTQVCTLQLGNFCLAYKWQAGIHPLVTFTTSPVQFVMPACTTGSTNFTLPTVLTSSFSGINSTTGQSPFNVSFTCSASTKVSITLATNSAAAGVTGSGVIAPTSGSGYAQGVGVQILDTPTHAITFGTPVSAGTVSSGVVSVPFYARYYQTGNTVTGGNVKALATYTLTYQ